MERSDGFWLPVRCSPPGFASTVPILLRNISSASAYGEARVNV
jgi:hypothetical protein